MPEELPLTPLEVAERLRIAKNTVYELIKRGELKGYRVGKKVRVEPSEVEAYKRRGRPVEATLVVSETDSIKNEPTSERRRTFVLCGQDPLLDVLALQTSQGTNGFPVLRSYLGSYNGLYALYRGEVDVATAHLWDQENDTYNFSFVRAMLPGVSSVLVHLAHRPVGFYVAKGNPKKILSWDDWKRPEVRLVNRELGSGMRVLIDQKLRHLNLSPDFVHGYSNEAGSHLAAATAVARGEGDVSVGNQKAAAQISGVDFVYLNQESYDLVFPATRENDPRIRRLLAVVRSPEFRQGLEALGGYDLTRLGQESART